MKAKKEKEWKEKMDKDRLGMFEKNFLHFSWKDKASEIITKMSSKPLPKYLSEDQEIKICFDFSNRISNIIISGYEEKSLVYQMPNCLSYFNDEINNRSGCFFGQEYCSYKTTETLYPVEQGIFNNYDLLELLMEYMIRDKINYQLIENQSVLFTEPINSQKEDKEKIAQILFEDFYITRLFIIKPSVLNLLSKGKYTGTVAELDYDISSFIPIFDCYSLPHAIITSNLCRKDMIDYMENSLNQKYSFGGKNIKYTSENLLLSCYVAQNYEKEFNKVETYSYIRKS